MRTFDNFDAVTYQSTDETYWFFKGKYCWSKRYGSHDVQFEGNIGTQFPGVGTSLEDLDAALYNGEKYWFFKGDKCWSKAHGNHDVQDQGAISDQFHCAPSNLDGACYSKGLYWFFKEGDCWSKEYGNHDTVKRGSVACQFPGAPLPVPLNGFTEAQGTYWFFHGDKCWSKAYGNHEVKARGKIVDEFPYYPTVSDPSSWMYDSLGTLGDKYLWQVSLPGTHDSGMSSADAKTAFAWDCNVRTQSKTVLQQLHAGARYFDIRPVIGGGDFFTGHYSNIDVTRLGVHYSGWQGARGESIGSVISGVNEFATSQRELIILNLSHAYNTDDGYSDFKPKDWSRLLDRLTSKLQHLFRTKKSLLNEVRIRDYVANGSAVVIVIPDDVDYPSGRGVYGQSAFSVYDRYSNTDDLSKMTKDQLAKMREYAGSRDQLFLLSWTLTQSGTDAVGCASPLAPSPSIHDLADMANDHLYDVIGAITSTSYPGIISVDYLPDHALSVAFDSNLKRFG